MFSLVQPSRLQKTNEKSGHDIACCSTDIVDDKSTNNILSIASILVPALFCCQPWSIYGFCQVSTILPSACPKCWRWPVAWPAKLLPNPVPICELKSDCMHSSYSGLLVYFPVVLCYYLISMLSNFRPTMCSYVPKIGQFLPLMKRWYGVVFSSDHEKIVVDIFCV